MNKISIIVCSRYQELDDTFLLNITKDIGSEYEVIPLFNQDSISAAYNEGISRSDGNFICFLHEDIRIHTPGWGSKLIDLFLNDPSLGLIGVAGSMVKTQTPSGWWNCENDKKAMNIIQHFPNREKELQNIGFDGETMISAVSIDGVFMALRKDTKAGFDNRVKGFHAYDLSLCFDILKKKYKIGITNSILIEHFSYGMQTAEWLESIIKVHHYNSEIFPLFASSAHEFKNCRILLDKCLLEGRFNWFFYYWFRLIKLRPISKIHVHYLKKLIKR